MWKGGWRLKRYCDVPPVPPRVQIVREPYRLPGGIERAEWLRRVGLADAAWLTHDETLAGLAWGPDGALTLFPARYTDQLLTHHPTFRLSWTQLGRRTRERPSSTSNALPNTLGGASMVRCSDGRWLVARRSQRVAIDAGCWSVPVAGNFQFPYHLAPKVSQVVSRQKLLDWARGEMVREAVEELGLDEWMIDSVELRAVRGEERARKRPQTFFVMSLCVPSSEALGWWSQRADGEHREVLALTLRQIQERVARAGEWTDEIRESIRWIAAC